MKQLHLISGLPRSGSTLLCQILNMNPDFYATPTSPILDMLNAQQSVFSHNAGFKAVNRKELYNDFAEAQKAFLNTFYASHNVVFDKNRGWTMHLLKLDEILDNEDTKIIWTYRDPIKVVASMEKQHRKYPLIQHIEESAQAGSMSTMDSRISMWIADTGIMVTPARGLHEAIHTGYEDRIKIISYDNLCQKPQETMDGIHEFLGYDKYDYSKNDFKDLKQATTEHDTFYNYKYPHDIVEGQIVHSEPVIDGLEESYKAIIDKRFEWLNKHCNTTLTREANRRTKRSERMKLHKTSKNGKAKGEKVTV